MYDRLRAWLETFQSDSYTENVVAALVDCAEQLWLLDGLPPDASGALNLLDSAIEDEEIIR